MKLVNPANKRKYTIIVVGTGLAGASAAASLGELGYNVLNFCIQDSPRRAHSIAAQGGINAAKNYQNDGDSVYRLFYDTVKGGDYRSREANVYRLAQLSVNIIDQCVAQGVPFAREYGGLLDNRSFGGAQVSRTFYARGQTGQQLLLGAYQSLMRQVHAKTVRLFARREMLDLVVVDGKARGIIVRNLVTGEIERYAGDAVILATGGYGTVYYLSTNAVNSNVTAAWRAHKRGALFANPCFTQIHPTCIPVTGDHQSKLTLMSESLRNDGRVWVPKTEGRQAAAGADSRRASATTTSSASIRASATSCRATSRRATPSRRATTAAASARAAWPSISTSRTPSSGSAPRSIKEKYGNLFQMYQKITDEDPYKVPMRIYPAIHYTMGGLWVDYNLMSNVPGLHVLGEANFSDHGANRLGASALMQGLADGYFVIPYTIGDYLASTPLPKVTTDHDAFKEAADNVQKRRSTSCCRSRARAASARSIASSGASCGTTSGWRAPRRACGARSTRSRSCATSSGTNVSVPGIARQPQPEPRVRRPRRRLPRVRRAARARRAAPPGIVRRPFPRREPDARRRGAARRRALSRTWRRGSSRASASEPVLHKEPLVFEEVHPTQRSYK